MKEFENMDNVVSNLTQLFGDDKVKEMEVRTKSKEIDSSGNEEEVVKVTIETQFENGSKIELQLLNLVRIITQESRLPNLVQLFIAFSELLMTRSMAKWKKLNMNENYMKLLGIAFKLVSKINDRSLVSTYPVLSPHSKILNQVYIYFWQEYVQHEKEIRNIIAAFPITVDNIVAINGLSKFLEVEDFSYEDKDSEKCKNIQFFFDVLSTKFKKISDSVTKLEGKINKLEIKKERKNFVEFVNRVSLSNSDSSKKFLIAFLKSFGIILDGDLPNFVLGEMKHLFSDKFSFQSILFMNCLILSDFPAIIDTVAQTEPLFAVSLT
jgi:uncharacterized protein involved in tolerance to divalent cations